jgi:hypothetical protein
MKMMPKWMHKDAMEMVNIKKRYKIGCKNIMQKWTKKKMSKDYHVPYFPIFMDTSKDIINLYCSDWGRRSYFSSLGSTILKSIQIK